MVLATATPNPNAATKLKNAAKKALPTIKKVIRKAKDIGSSIIKAINN